MCIISVIVPVYNVEKYLKRCVDSILNQTFTDFELILVDDGSNDKSINICDEYVDLDSRVHVIHQDNKGQAFARNLGIEKSKGDYIAFIDSDDVVHPQYLEILYNACKKNKCDLSCCCSFEFSDYKKISFDKDIVTASSMLTIDEKLLEKLFYSKEYLYGVVWGKLIKKEIVLRNLFTPGRIYEDSALVCKWLYEACNIVKVDSSPLYFYYINEKGTMRGEFSYKQADILWSMSEQDRFYKNIKYNKMRTVVLSHYMISATNCYVKSKAVLSDKKFAKKIKYMALKKYVCNFWRIQLKGKWTYIFDCFFPKTMNFYYLFISLINKFRKTEKG